MKQYTRVFEGIGGSSAIPLGKFPTNICVQNSVFAVVFYVLHDQAMNVQAILGNEFLRQTSFSLKKGQRDITRTEVDDAVKPGGEYLQFNENSLFNICFPEDEDVHQNQCESLLMAVNSSVQDAIKKLIQSYSPDGQLPSPVQMKITMLDDTPVFDQPRRLAYADKMIVELKITDWLEAGVIRPSISTYSSAVV